MRVNQREQDSRIAKDPAYASDKVPSLRKLASEIESPDVLYRLYGRQISNHTTYNRKKSVNDPHPVEVRANLSQIRKDFSAWQKANPDQKNAAVSHFLAARPEVSQYFSELDVADSGSILRAKI